MGICAPWQNVHLEYRTAFANALGLTPSALTTLHGEFEDAIKHISRLATHAHHHTVARKHQCPRTWAEMQGSKSSLEAPMRVLEALVQPAKIDPLGGYDCSICALHRELTGSEQGLGCQIPWQGCSTSG
eukprot:1553776-Pyramimonas_sp.AAC.1